MDLRECLMFLKGQTEVLDSALSINDRYKPHPDLKDKTLIVVMLIGLVFSHT